jgi:hypothetical protein
MLAPRFARGTVQPQGKTQMTGTTSRRDFLKYGSGVIGASMLPFLKALPARAAGGDRPDHQQPRSAPDRHQPRLLSGGGELL